MKRKILVVLADALGLGGVERSLLGLLDAFDYEKYEVDLFLYGHHGSLFPLINSHVHLLPEVRELAYLQESLLEKLKHRCWYAAVQRVWASLQRWEDGIPWDEIWAKVMRLCAPKLETHYDIAISFNSSVDYLTEKVDADIKVGWIHTDYTSFDVDLKEMRRQYSQPDYIAAVSEDCKRTFSELFPDLASKVFVVENILPKALIEKQANEFSTEKEMPDDETIKLLSIGRFCEAKNFDNVPEICKLIRENGLNVKWYLIGFGGSETLIRQKISEFGMENYVIILGKKENPYPYIKACDIYVQPSRYEGKSVSVREAQMLHKPVIITNYATAGSQLRDEYDGVVVPMDNEDCAKGISAVIRDKELQSRLIANTKQNDYTNAKEVEKLYRLIEQ